MRLIPTIKPGNHRRNPAILLCVVLICAVFCAVPAGAETIDVSDFSGLQTAITAGGSKTILITEDITMQSISISSGSDIILKPSGKSVTLSFADCSGISTAPGFILIYSGGNLTLSGDAGHTLTIQGSTAAGNSAPLIENRGGNLSIENGAVLTGHVTAGRYACIKNKGSVVMNGGEISGCSGQIGGAVSLIESGSTFVMNGGVIRGNSADSGSAVHCKNGAVFQMNGGSITGNTGYAVYLTGANNPSSVITFSGYATLDSLHFLNEISDTMVSVSPVTIAHGFSGSISGISVENYVPDMQIAKFASAADASSQQEQFTTRSDTYQLTASEEYLVLGLAPALRFAEEDTEYTTIPGGKVTIPVSLEVFSKKVSLLRITASVADEQGNPISNLQYIYTVKDPNPFSVIDKNGAELTLSTGTDITADIAELFTLTIQNTENLQEETTCTVTLIIESSVSNAEDYTVYPVQTLQIPVTVIPFLLDSDNNSDSADKFGSGLWSFTHKASVTYIISPADGNLSQQWPTVSRNPAASYQYAETELTGVSVYKSVTPYNSANPQQMVWVSASSTVTKNTDRTIRFTRAAEDADAACFKLEFTGRKLGDVVEGTGDINTVNMYDIDMILHAAVDSSQYIKPVWRLYADADSNGIIQLNDAVSAFNFIRGYV